MIKILIGTPVYDNCSPEYVESIVDLITHNKDKYDIKLSLSPGYSVSQSRNKIVDTFIKGPYEYLLFMDSDIIAPTSIIDLLLLENKPVISAVYRRKTLVSTEVEIFKLDSNHIKTLQLEEVPENTFRIDACGFGCILIKREVIEALLEVYPRLFEYNEKEGGQLSEDIFFCVLANSLSIDLYCNGKVKVGHVGKFLY